MEWPKPPQIIPQMPNILPHQIHIFILARMQKKAIVANDEGTREGGAKSFHATLRKERRKGAVQGGVNIDYHRCFTTHKLYFAKKFLS